MVVDKVLPICMKLTSYRLPQQMRMQPKTTDRTMLVAEILHASVSQLATLANEEIC